MTAPAYQLTDITRSYGARTVLMLQEFLVQPGEILAVVGPSGAGKSTLLRLLNFLEAPDTGDLHYQGMLVRYPPGPPLAVRRQVTTVFQRTILLNRSVAENVAYGLRVRGKRDSYCEVEAFLEAVGMRHLADAPARTLSGGEAQRVALARALILRPRVLLLDEPTANLDPGNVAAIEQIVRDENSRRGTTMVLVTHNIFQARRLAHRTALLLEGRLVEVAPTAQFFEQPHDGRTAAFVQGEIPY